MMLVLNSSSTLQGQEKLVALSLGGQAGRKMASPRSSSLSAAHSKLVAGQGELVAMMELLVSVLACQDTPRAAVTANMN